jgi:hypothetical protein
VLGKMPMYYIKQADMQLYLDIIQNIQGSNAS